MEARKAQLGIKSLSQDLNAGSLNQLFVIQKHYASRVHFDFRLEMEDPETKKRMFISWAVPKNLPTIFGVKHLAIRVENYLFQNLKFKNEILVGEYGTGKVEVWDQGNWGLLKGDLANGSFSFNLFGKKSKGRYQMALIKKFNKKAEKEKLKEKYWLIWLREPGVLF